MVLYYAFISTVIDVDVAIEAVTIIDLYLLFESTYMDST